ncbi:MAG: hypothetical protein JSV89_12920 [Spirochaetaceae bacterium]|nr:MAG: hypothetical protein JSV89_12920 [Spirochaetaceae bacterium]
MRQIQRDLNVGDSARQGKILDVIFDGVEVVETKSGIQCGIEYHTPVGGIRTVRQFTGEAQGQGLPATTVEYLLKEPKDFKVWEWIVEHARYEPKYEEFNLYDAQVGEMGLPVVEVGRVPFNDFLFNLAGYEQAFYLLNDYPQEVEHLLEVMVEAQRLKLWPVISCSPAKLVVHGVHLASQLTPPPLFRKYILPFYQELIPLLHDHGKYVAMHADNDTSLILDLIERSGWDMVECFVTAPMVPVTLRQARETWGSRMIIWGGIPSSMLSPSVSESDFRSYVGEVLRTIAPGDAFILGVADNVMPDSMIERVEWISEFLEKNGRYPIENNKVRC